jgi:hypothetical protein
MALRHRPCVSREPWLFRGDCGSDDCLLILLILISQWFEIDFILGAFVAGAVVRAALAEYELKATAVRRNWLRFLCAAPQSVALALHSETLAAVRQRDGLALSVSQNRLA